MSDLLSYEIKEQMRENSHSLVEVMILEEQAFRLVLWNNNNWSSPLPEKIMESFPNQLVIDIKDMALDESYVDEATNEIILCTSFEGEVYTKVLQYDEIIAVLDLKGQPYTLNNFEQETVEPDVVYDMKPPANRQEWINIAVSGGIEEAQAEKSINAFIKNNEHLQYLK